MPDAPLNDTTTALTLLHTRRSGKPRDMTGPGPSAAQLHAILAAAIRVPDHGKLSPWRFVVVAAGQRARLRDVLVDAYRATDPDATSAQIEAVEGFAHQSPVLIVALSSPVPGKIPVWEQELSVGAAIQNLLIATHASGFVGGWLTGWPAYNDTVRDAFGAAHERIAGFMFIGTPVRPLEERARPEYDRVVSDWKE